MDCESFFRNNKNELTRFQKKWQARHVKLKACSPKEEGKARCVGLTKIGSVNKPKQHQHQQQARGPSVGR